MTRVKKIDNSILKRDLIKKEKKLSRKGLNAIPIKESFLIICEGKNTEPEYFNSFRLSSATVKSMGTGSNTKSLVNKAMQIRKLELNKGNKFDQYWCVFDKDGFSNDDFNSAISMAEANGFKVGYSNQAFEFWLLLHFNIYEGSLDRSKYEGLLSQHLKMKYLKEEGFCTKLFVLIYAMQETAIHNAKQVYNNAGNHYSPATEESSTTVFKLVEELRKFLS